ncbi:MAG TPA: GAF domain-containing protein, partial [Anaerolineae bacterium]|nr:GAF domain-containing protein [Anaerolineae bacterium]
MSAGEQNLQSIYKTTLQRVQELEYLVDLSQNLTTSLDVDEVLEQIADGVVKILRAFGCAIFLLEEDDYTLIPRVVIDPDFKDTILNAPINIDNCLTGKAIKAKRGLIFNDILPENSLQIPGTAIYETESVLSVPLIADGVVLGAMTINRMDEQFTDNDLWLAEAFGRYAAIALKNAQIHRALQLSNERFKQLFENMNSGVAVYQAIDDGQDFIIVDFNAAGERIGRIDRRNVIGKSVRVVFPEVEFHGLMDVIRRVWQTGKPEKFLLNFCEQDKLPRWRN